MLIAAVAASPAGAQNLVVNGGAEAGSPGTSIPGWTTTGGFQVVAYGTSGPGGDYPTAAHGTAIGGGSNLFAGGSNDALSTARQTIDVSGDAAAIDAGNLEMTLSALLGGFLTQSDNARVDAVYRSASGGELGRGRIGPVSNVDRGSASILLPRSGRFAVPSGTRSIEVVITSTRTTGTQNDGYVDNVSLTLGAPASPACTLTWDGGASGSWNVATNWDADRLPAATDVVCIPAGSTVTYTTATSTVQALRSDGTLVVSSGALDVSQTSKLATLTLNGGTLGGGGALTVGTFNWSLGTHNDGAMTTVTGALTVSGTTTKVLADGRTLVVAPGATAVHADSGAWTVNSGTSVLNYGDFDFTGSGGLTGTGAFTNNGVADLTASKVFQTAFNNNGTFNVTVATASLQGGGTSDADGGTFTIADGGSIHFQTGTHSLGPSSITGSGFAMFSATSTTLAAGGTLDVPNVWLLTGSATIEPSFTASLIQVSAGTLTLNGATTTSQLNLSGGTLTGTGAISTGNFQWDNGDHTGAATTTVTTVLHLPSTGAIGKRLYNNRALVTAPGVATHYSGTGLVIGMGASFTNGGLFDITGDQDIGPFNTVPTFTNNGTIRKSAGTGATELSVDLVNNGTLSVHTGEIELDRGGSSDSDGGLFSISDGATLDFAGGTFNLGPSAITGLGPASRVTFTATGGSDVVNIGPGGPGLNVDNVDLVSGRANFGSNSTGRVVSVAGNGTIGGAATFTATQSLNWTGGFMRDAGTTRIGPSATMTIASGSTKHLDGRRLENKGSAQWTGDSFSILNGGVLANEGIFETPFDGTIFGTSGRIENSGRFAKTGGAGTTLVTPCVDNEGVVRSESGVLALQGGSCGNVVTGAYVAVVGSEVAFTGGTHALGPHSAVTGTGTIAVRSGATLSVSGVWNVSGTTRLSGGTVDFNSPASSMTTVLEGATLGGTGTYTAGGTMTWSGGTMTGAGTTFVGPNATLNITTTGSKTLTGARTLRNGASGAGTISTINWSGGNISSGQGAVIENNSRITLQGDVSLFSNLSGTPTVFRNAGSFSKQGGSGTATINAVVVNDTGVDSRDARFDVTTGTLVFDRSVTNGNRPSSQFVAQGASPPFRPVGGTIRVTGTLTNFDPATGTLTGGSYTVWDGGTIEFTGADVRTNQASFVLTGPGSRVLDEAGRDAFRNFAVNGSSGRFFIQGDRDVTTPGAFTNTGIIGVASTGTTLTTGGTFTQTGAAASTSVALGGVLVAGGAGADINGGVLMGDGTVVGPLANAARVAPGQFPGSTRTLTNDGAYTQAAAGRLQIEIAGTPASGSYDRLAVTDATTLSGVLDVDRLSGYTPTVGDRFEVVTFASRTGTFAEVDGEIGAGRFFRAEYSDTAVTVVVDERRISVGDATVSEGTGGTTTLSFPVSLHATGGSPAPSSAATTARYTLAAGSAGGGDFDGDPATGTLTIPAGQTSGTLAVDVTTDALDEEDSESFSLTLSFPTNAALGDSSATGTITDDDPLPALSVADASFAESSAGGDFTVSLGAPSGRTVTVAYETVTGSASGGDYGGVSDTLTFMPGQTTKTVRVSPTSDSVDEPDESFTLRLTAPANATIADGEATGTIADDDAEPSVGVADSTATEANAGTTATFTVTLAAASGRTVQVDWATAPGTAGAGDFDGASGTLAFAPGETTKTITIQVVGDATDEPDESFSLALSNPVNVTLGDAAATATISDDDPPPAISIADAAAGESGAGGASFTVTLTNPSAHPVTIDFATAPGTAGPGDFQGQTGTITFAPGETTKTITVPVNDDPTDEPSETFTVTLSNPTNASVGDGEATGTITTDGEDPAPALAVADAVVNEGDTGTVAATFTVALSAASGKGVTVDYATSNGTAGGGDYEAASGSLSFAPGETTKSVTVQVRGDRLDEQDETFRLTLANAANAALGDPEAMATITDDDGAASLGVADSSALEGNAGTSTASFTVTVSPESGTRVTVAYSTSPGTATSSDFEATSGTLTFEPGETSKTIAVPVRGDLLDEPDETFLVNLSAPENAGLGDAQATGTIADDDAEPGLAVADALVTEGNTGSTAASFAVSLSAPSGKTVTVDYSTVNGTAGGSDYVGATGSLTFAPGETSKTVAVDVRGDQIDEPNETFRLVLANAANATLADPEAVGTIADDEGAPAEAVADAAANEGNAGTTPLTFTVVIAPVSGQTVTIDYATAAGTAGANDFQPTSGSLTFAPGETQKTVTVQVVGDTADEPDETFFLNLTNGSNVVLADAQAVGTIRDDDEAVVVAAGLGLTMTEDADPVQVGANLTYTIAVGNSGPSAATGVRLTDTLPAGATLVSASASQGSCVATGATVLCELGTLAAGASATVTLVVRPDAPGELTNGALVTATEPDPLAGDNAASTTTTVRPAPLAPPPRCRIQAAGKLVAGKKSLLRIAVAVLGTRAPVADTLVRVRGAGVRGEAQTGRRGVANLRVRPTRAGVLQIRVPTLTRCTASIRVAKAQPAAGLAGRPTVSRRA